MVKNKDLIRKAPETWCAGGGTICGFYNLRKQFLAAVSEYMEKNDLKKEDVIGVSGIGCSGRFTVWQDFVTTHTTHGNASNLAQGIAITRGLSKKKSLIYIVSGDGDALAIGRANFENLCHSNVNVTYMILNNGIYAMTAGQTAPTTYEGTKTTSAPFGCLEKPWDTISLALEAGATFVARTSSYHKESKILKEILLKAFEHEGVSIIEILSACQTQNPQNKRIKISDLEEDYLKNSVDIKELESFFPKEQPALKYLRAKEFAKKELNKDIVKGIIYETHEKTLERKILEQKEKLKESFPEPKLSQKIRRILKNRKI